MPTISIVHRHALSHKAAKDAAQRVVDDLKKRFDLEYAWDGDDVAFDRPGVSGRMHVGKDEIALDVKLGLLLGALKSTVEREIRAQLDALFATPAPTTARTAKATGTAKPTGTTRASGTSKPTGTSKAGATPKAGGTSKASATSSTSGTAKAGSAAKPAARPAGRKPAARTKG